jgi:hypothetical protein
LAKSTAIARIGVPTAAWTERCPVLPRTSQGSKQWLVDHSWKFSRLDHLALHLVKIIASICAGASRRRRSIRFSTPVDVEFTAMVEGNNRAAFRWYFPKHETFSGIFQKPGSFDGIEPIFPSSYYVRMQ